MLPWKILRFPLVFGGCLTAYFGAFSLRKIYFRDEVEGKRDQNIIRAQAEYARLETAQHQVKTELANRKIQDQK